VIDSHASAVLAYNDLMAIGLLQAAHKRRDTVPGRLSIIGFDDIFGSDFTSPPLTTIRTPLRLMGELAVRHALELVGTGVHGASAALSADLPPLTTELVVRGSTGPVGREPRGPLREPLRGGAANEI
jgi:LacI family transcriptional regulator